MNLLNLDVETKSSYNIKTVGYYKYTEAPDFDIVLLSYSIDKGPVITIDLTVDLLPLEVEEALTDPHVIKQAYNAAFERQCFTVYLNRYMPPEQWRCTMVKAAMVGLPFGLDQVAKALHLPVGKQTEGKALIKYFCSPCKPTKVNGGRTWNLPHHNPEKWQRFKEYNAQDVVVEMAAAEKIEFFEVPEMEKQLWILDCKMNDRGVMIDTQFVNQAIKLNTENSRHLVEKAVALTGLDNPNSGPQLKAWLTEQTDEQVDKLTKNVMPGMLKKYFDLPALKEVINIKQELSKTSNKKYPKMLHCINGDKRARGTIQYYGAGRTGRYAGRLFQPQNLTKTVLPNKNKAYDYYELSDGELQIARDLILKGDSDTIEMLFGNVPDTLSACIRTALVAAPGHRFLPVDLSAIEARVIAWLANEKWRLDVFSTHGKIYEASGAAMFKVPIETITKGSKLRDKAKIAELALGFQGGAGALVRMGALEMGLTEDELPELVYAWRAANKRIVQYWYDIGNAALQCVADRVPVLTNKGIRMHVEKGVLFITLPSGRRLAYLRPKITASKYGGQCVSYEGMDQDTKQWKRIDTYGGKLVENIVQGTARDILAAGMLRLDKAGYQLVLSVHDEAVPEMPEGVGTLEEAVKIMAMPVKWAPGLPLAADGFESKYYKK